MMYRLTLLTAACCTLLLAACKKNNNGGNSGPNPLIGNWTFDNETSNATATSTAMVGPLSVKVVNLLDFKTIDNTGGIAFNSDSMVLTGVGYDIDTTVTTYTYTGLTIDTSTSPLTETVPPADTLTTYKLIGQDSLYFPSGLPFAVNLQGFQPTIQIMGVHFKVNGATLTMTSTINQTGQETYNGITAPTTVLVNSVITLTKQ